jgi:prepilin-type processing-associated H-X9-DG protein
MRLEQAPPLLNERKKVSRLAYASLLMVLLFLVFSLISTMVRGAYREYYSPPIIFAVLFILSQLGIFLTPIFGFFLGALGRVALTDPDYNARGKWLATVGLLLNSAIIIVFFVYPIIRSTRGHRPRQASCMYAIKELGKALDLYTTYNKNLFPPIDDRKNNFIFEGKVLYPEYFADHVIAHCPQHPDYDPEKIFRLISNHPDDSAPVSQAHPDCFTSDGYIYLGWLVTNDEEAKAFFEAYDKLSLEEYYGDIIVPEGKGNGGGDVIHRLTAGVDRFLVEDINEVFGAVETPASTVPIIWDRPYTDPERFSHQYEDGIGGNVCYLDGHVEFVRFGEKFPMTETMARLLEERPRDPIPYCEEIPDE